MDEIRFDVLTRSLKKARSRRSALATLLGGPLGLLGLAGTVAKKSKHANAEGKGKSKGKKKKKRENLPPFPLADPPPPPDSLSPPPPPPSPPPPSPVCTPSCTNGS